MLRDKLRANRFALFCCALFLLTGLPWIWRPGIQTDEALFTAGIYGPHGGPESRVNVFGHEYTLMVMTYVGTLKSRIWSPIFRTFGVTAGSMRIPALVIGALTVWWFWRLLDRTLGRRAAIVGTALLATDPLYMLTVRWDWGPVALQHALLIGGVLAIVTWWQKGRTAMLALGFFAFGLAMWDKALFAWSLVGLTVATAVCFPRALFDSIRKPKLLVIAGVFFLLGATPLIIYNLRNDWITFRSNTERATEDLSYKAHLVIDTVDASALFGSITREDWQEPKRTPDRPLERAVVAVSNAFGNPKHTVQLLLLVCALLLLPLVWRTPARTAVLFALIFSLVTWAQMASLKNGGTGVHHSILLWPTPALIIAAVAGEISARTAKPERWTAGLVAVAMISGLLVTSTYHRDMVRNGGTPAWTEAFYPAFKYLRDRKAHAVCIMEWGFYDNLRAFGRGRLPLEIANDPAANADEQRFALLQFENRDNVFIRHTKGNEIEPGRADRIIKFAEEHGYRRNDVQTFYDTNGRGVIETFSFIKTGN